MNKRNMKPIHPFLYLVLAILAACNPLVRPAPDTQSDAVKKGTPENARVHRVGNVPVGARWYNIQCVGREVCWLGDTLKRWQTTDGGRTWKLLYSADSEEQEIRSDTYIDAKLGWRVSTKGRLYKTEDGGRTWRESSTPMSELSGELRMVKFPKDGNSGWLAGGVYRSLSEGELTRGVPNNTYDPATKSVLEGAIFRSKDGGETWHKQTLPARPGRVYKLYFLDEAHIVVLSDSGIFHTKDGGNRWTDANFKRQCVAQQYRDGYAADPVDVFFVDSKIGWLAFDDGRVAKSMDGGRSWCDWLSPGTVPFALPFDRYFKKIYFADTKHGWALGGDEFIYETIDGGSSWIRFGEMTFDDLYFSDPNFGLAVSKEGLYRIN